MYQFVRERDDVLRLATVVLCSALLLTAGFVGLVAAVGGDVVNVEQRLPFYVLGGAVVFVVAMFLLEDPDEHGTPIFTTTVGIGVAAFALLALAGEGVLYATANPNQVFGSQLVVYFLAAALVCTAVGYWGLHHWREYAA